MAPSPSVQGKGPGVGAAPKPKPAATPKPVNRGPELQKVAESIAPGTQLGELLLSGAPCPLTESEAEYTVAVIKHMFPQHAMLEFVVANTVPGVSLETIRIALGACAKWKNLGQSLIPELGACEAKSAYCLLAKEDAPLGVLAGRFSCTLAFIMKEEGDDLGNEDDYPVEAFSIANADYVLPKPLGPGQFKSAWEQLPAEHTQKFALPYKSLEAAVPGLIAALHLAPCEKSEVVEAGARGTTLFLSGTFCGGAQVAAKCIVAFDPSRGCLLKIAVRSNRDEVSAIVCKALE